MHGSLTACMLAASCWNYCLVALLFWIARNDIYNYYSIFHVGLYLFHAPGFISGGGPGGAFAPPWIQFAPPPLRIFSTSNYVVCT